MIIANGNAIDSAAGIATNSMPAHQGASNSRPLIERIIGMLSAPPTRDRTAQCARDPPRDRSRCRRGDDARTRDCGGTDERRPGADRHPRAPWRCALVPLALPVGDQRFECSMQPCAGSNHREAKACARHLHVASPCMPPAVHAADDTTLRPPATRSRCASRARWGDTGGAASRSRLPAMAPAAIRDSPSRPCGPGSRRRCRASGGRSDSSTICSPNNSSCASSNSTIRRSVAENFGKSLIYVNDYRSYIE